MALRRGTSALLRDLEGLAGRSEALSDLVHGAVGWCFKSGTRALQSWTRGQRNGQATPARPGYRWASPPLARRPDGRGMSVVVSPSRHASSTVVAPGTLVQFRRGDSFHLGRVVRPNSRGWQVEDARGTLYGVRAADIAFQLPTGENGLHDLAALDAEVESLLDSGLLALGWEVSDPGATYGVADMARFLYGRDGTAACAAAHRLLLSDALFFRKVGRQPPTYSPRDADAVAALRADAAARLAAAARMSALRDAIAAAEAAPRGAKPDWAAGEFAGDMATLETYALGRATPAGAVRAVTLLQNLGVSPSVPSAGTLLQRLGVLPAELDVAMAAAGYALDFPPEILEAAEKLASDPPPDPDAGSRRDLTGLPCATIDDASTTEIDDGLGMETLPDGRIKVWVHVADPSRWVQGPGSPLAAAAAARSTSVYLPDALVPMFPRTLAEGPFSLRRGVPGPALSFGFVIRPDGSLDESSIDVCASTVCPDRRLTYDDVDAMLDERALEQEPLVHTLHQLAEARAAWRKAQGAVAISMPEAMIGEARKPDGQRVVQITELRSSASRSRNLVAEMMIAAGQATAALGASLGLALPYRGQPTPVLPEAEELEAVPPGVARDALLRSRMLRSVMGSAGPLPHAGLGLAGYVQVTSPIRRYTDLLAHWQLKARLRGEQPPMDEPELSVAVAGAGAASQIAQRLERDVQTRWVARYFAERGREEPGKGWNAVLLSWVKQEAGIARLLLEGLGLEVTARLMWPAERGSRWCVTCVHADEEDGTYQLEAREAL